MLKVGLEEKTGVQLCQYKNFALGENSRKDKYFGNWSHFQDSY